MAVQTTTWPLCNHSNRKLMINFSSSKLWSTWLKLLVSFFLTLTRQIVKLWSAWLKLLVFFNLFNVFFSLRISHLPWKWKKHFHPKHWYVVKFKITKIYCYCRVGLQYQKYANILPTKSTSELFYLMENVYFLVVRIGMARKIFNNTEDWSTRTEFQTLNWRKTENFSACCRSLGLGEQLRNACQFRLDYVRYSSVGEVVCKHGDF